jgi:TIR domain
MPNRTGNDQPLVFLSFAGPDRPMAKRLGGDLAARGFDAFIDEHSIAPGEEILLAINRALTNSSYCVLLWSRHTWDRPWVDMEWGAALARELDSRRSFLFVIRLDDSDMPLILATRRYLDASAGWEAAVAELVATWQRDRDAGPNVFPAPGHTAAVDSSGVGEIELYVRNRALSVSHVVRVASAVTGPQLSALVAEALELPESESKFGGLVGARFTYELRHRDQPLPDRPITDLGIGCGDTVDLLVQVEFVSRGETTATWTFRDGQASQQPGTSPRVARALLDAAFGHLMPTQ